MSLGQVLDVISLTKDPFVRSLIIRCAKDMNMIPEPFWFIEWYIWSIYGDEAHALR